MLLRDFVQTFYRSAPQGKVDGRAMDRAWTTWAIAQGMGAQPTTRFYDDLRHFGFLVRPGARNKMQVFGIAVMDDRRDELTQLENAWTDVPITTSERETTDGLLAYAGPAGAPLTIKPEIVEEAVAGIIEIARTAVDQRVRLQAWAMIIDRGIARLGPRKVEPEPEAEEVVEVVEVKDHLSLDEVEAVLRSRIAAAG